MSGTDKKTNKQEEMGRTVTSLTFNDDQPSDHELISLANAYGRLPKNQGIPLTSSVRNLLLRTFKKEIAEDESQQKIAG